MPFDLPLSGSLAPGKSYHTIESPAMNKRHLHHSADWDAYKRFPHNSMYIDRLQLWALLLFQSDILYMHTNNPAINIAYFRPFSTPNFNDTGRIYVCVCVYVCVPDHSAAEVVEPHSGIVDVSDRGWAPQSLPHRPSPRPVPAERKRKGGRG